LIRPLLKQDRGYTAFNKPHGVVIIADLSRFSHAGAWQLAAEWLFVCNRGYHLVCDYIVPFCQQLVHFSWPIADKPSPEILEIITTL
jgi:hypothetical protein